ncbi:MAG: cysteine desulfurase NifS [Candidatus Brocadia sp.]|jgi:cysteine desulfurase
MKVVYADNNATTKVAPEVLEAMMPYFTEYYGNPSSMHTFGGQVAKKIDMARQQVADLIGSDPVEIVFTSCGTESDNAAIWGILRANPHKRHIVTSRVEHPAVYNLCKYLAQSGYHVTELGVDSNGMLNLNELADAVREDTAIVSIMYANNETGVIFPIEEIGHIVKEKGSILHTDAVQAVGKIPLNLSKSTIDLLTLSGHKLHAPKGVGALFIRKGITFTPFIIGGHQERNRRGGTENVPSIIGLGKACELAKKYMAEEQTRVKQLRDKLENEILRKAPDARVNGHKTHRLPNTTNLSFEFVEGEAILLLLNEKGICASSGSACTSGSLEPSHVLRAMGVPFTAVHGSVRLSLSRYNTMEDVDFIIEHLPPIIKRLREISPYGRETRLKEQSFRISAGA